MPVRPEAATVRRSAAGRNRSRCGRARRARTDSPGYIDNAIRMHYNDCVLKTVRESNWSADHVAAHDVTLDEVREAILEHPYWSVPGRQGTTLIYGRSYAGRYLFVVAIAEGEEAFTSPLAT